MSTKTTLAHGPKWFLQEDHDGSLLLEIDDPAVFRACLADDAGFVVVQVPSDLARRIQQVPTAQIVEITPPGQAPALEPGWLRLLTLLYNEGATSKRKGRQLADLPGCKGEPRMAGAARALVARGLVEIEVFGGQSAFYWVSMAGLERMREEPKK